MKSSSQLCKSCCVVDGRQEAWNRWNRDVERGWKFGGAGPGRQAKRAAEPDKQRSATKTAQSNGEGDQAGRKVGLLGWRVRGWKLVDDAQLRNMRASRSMQVVVCGRSARCGYFSE
jgi:hypothetical protein